MAIRRRKVISAAELIEFKISNKKTGIQMSHETSMEPGEISRKLGHTCANDYLSIATDAPYFEGPHKLDDFHELGHLPKTNSKKEASNQIETVMAALKSEDKEVSDFVLYRGLYKAHMAAGAEMCEGKLQVDTSHLSKAKAAARMAAECSSVPEKIAHIMEVISLINCAAADFIDEKASGSYEDKTFTSKAFEGYQAAWSTLLDLEPVKNNSKSNATTISKMQAFYRRLALGIISDQAEICAELDNYEKFKYQVNLGMEHLSNGGASKILERDIEKYVIARAWEHNQIWLEDAFSRRSKEDLI